MTVKELLSYQNNFSSTRLWEKLRNYAVILGKQTVYSILVLYYVMIDKKTPWKYKSIIAGALGYLILPVDAIPDGLPIIGFSDDIAAITAAYKAVKDAINPDIEAKAKARLYSWFP